MYSFPKFSIESLPKKPILGKDTLPVVERKQINTQLVDMINATLFQVVQN